MKKPKSRFASRERGYGSKNFWKRLIGKYSRRAAKKEIRVDLVEAKFGECFDCQNNIFHEHVGA